MPSPARIVASLRTADHAIRWRIVGDLGTIRRRRDTGTFFLDFRPYGRVYRHRGIPITDEGTARRILEQIRGKVAEGRHLEEVLAEYLPVDSKPNLVPTRVERWLEVKRQETAVGDRSPTYLRELERYAQPGGHFSWWSGRSIYEIDYAALEDWSLWLAKRSLSAKTRANVLGAFRSFVGWLRRRGELLSRSPWRLTRSELEIPSWLWPQAAWWISIPRFSARFSTGVNQPRAS